MSAKQSILEEEMKREKECKGVMEDNVSAKPALVFSKEARRAAIVSFEQNDERGLSAFIDTENLRLHSVTKKDEDSYIQLYGDKVVMEKFATGVV